MTEKKEKPTGKKNTPYHRIIVKFGTSLLTGGSDSLNEHAISKLVSQVARLQKQGLELLVVSSGAIAAGRHKLGRDKNRGDVAFKQVLAAIGQGKLMNVYDQLFTAYDITVAQALLTKTDLADRAGYQNARNTLLALMELQVVGIINENDVVAVDEIQESQFGDNDNLSAMVAGLVDADLLLILSDIAGLHTADPKQDSAASLIPLVENIDRDIENLMTEASGNLGTGGIATKIEAARLATSSGVTVIVADGREPDIILDAVSGKPVGTRFSPAPRA